LTIRATINYFDSNLERGRFDVIEPERNLMRFEAHEIDIHDLRDATDVSLEREGFMLAQHHSLAAHTPEIRDTNLKAESGVPPINRRYYDELLPLIGQISGARAVIPQATGLTVRFSRRSQRQSWAGAADFAHLDVTQQSAGKFLNDSLAAADPAPTGWQRFVMFQTWRAISEPPQDNLLTVCDRSSVPNADVAYYDAIIGEKGTTLGSIEARSCRYGEGHRWYYISDMGPDDLLIFIGYDSADPDGVQPFHTGFDIPGNENASPRVSLEARFFAFYD